MTVKAIETTYAGCRFRSRLEARWAVFFDHAGIEWEYEPQGFELPSGRRYLPDFWLRESHAWFEVKGPVPTEDDRATLLEFARELPSPPDTGWSSIMSREGLTVSQYLKVAVGDIPRPSHVNIWNSPSRWEAPEWSPGWIWRVLPIDGGASLAPRWWNRCPRGHTWVGWGWCWPCHADELNDNVPGYGYGSHDAAFGGPCDEINRALAAARSARFEHDAREVW